MKKAKEIIVSTLKEEIPFLTEEKYDSMAIRLVKELGLTDVKIFDINEAKENGYETFTPMRYNLELSLEDILLVKFLFLYYSISFFSFRFFLLFHCLPFDFFLSSNCFSFSSFLKILLNFPWRWKWWFFCLHFFFSHYSFSEEKEDSRIRLMVLFLDHKKRF